MTFEIVECEPGRSLTIKSQEAVIHLTGSMLGLEEPVVTRVVRRQLEHDLLTLKDLLEASAATHQSAG